MSDLRDEAKAFGEANRTEGGDGWQLMADFAEQHAQQVRTAEREKIAARLRVMYRDHGGVNRISSLGREVAQLYVELEAEESGKEQG